MPKITAVILTILMLMLAGAAAEPSFDSFSPGYDAAQQAADAGQAIRLEAALRLSSALHITDMSVLSAFFDGARLVIDTCRADGRETTALTLFFADAPAWEAAIGTDEGGTRLSLDGRLLDASALARTDALPAAPQGLHRFTRMPLEAIETMLPALPGARLQAERKTDGEGRLTRLDMTGTLTLVGEPWQAQAYFQRPGGKAPKDTAEVSLIKDDDNKLTLALSAQQKQNVRGKGDKGNQTVSTRVTLTGKLRGNKVSGTLTITQKNAWQVGEDGALSERITVKTKLAWQDRTPERRELHLNRINLNVEETMHVRSGGQAQPDWDDEADFSLFMDGEKTLAGQLTLRAAAGPEPPSFPAGVCVPVTAGELLRELRAQAQQVAAQIVPRLDEKTKSRIRKGL